MRAKLHQHISRYVCKTMNNTTMGKLRIIGYWGKRELHSRKVQEALEWRTSIYILRYDALSKCRPCVLHTYKSEYFQIKQSSGGTGFRFLCALRLYLYFLESLHFSSARLLHVHFECFRLLARCENFDIDFETVFNDSFKRYGLVIDTFAAELAWVCLPCVCVHYLLVILSVSSLWDTWFCPSNLAILLQRK